MPLITLEFETWRAVADELRAEGLPPYVREHAQRLERMLDEHGPGEATVSLNLSDDVYLRSYNHARLVLGIPLPPPGWAGDEARRPRYLPGARPLGRRLHGPTGKDRCTEQRPRW